MKGPGVGQSGIPEKVTLEADIGGGAEHSRHKRVKEHSMHNNTTGKPE